MLLNILFIAIVVLAIVTAVRLVKVFEWTRVLSGKKPYEITESENNLNAVLVLLSLVGMVGMFFYLNNIYYFNDKLMLPESASEHGKEVDSLLELNFMVISLVFLLTQTLLMWFAYRYRYNQKRKALHYAHNNKLELIWTVIPAIVLTVLILYGLAVWNKTANPTFEDNRITMELYAKQFEWAARYAGEDKKLGEANYCMIPTDDVNKNPLGLITSEMIERQLVVVADRIRVIDSTLNFGFPDKKMRSQLLRELSRAKNQYQVVKGFELRSKEQRYESSYDDVLITAGKKIVIPVGRQIELKMRSQDVIHSAYLPHFRVHMYCVPGIATNFTFRPIITTQEMRDKLDNPKFNYLLYCNNICGSSHFGMQMEIEVVTEEEYALWWSEQKTFKEAYITGDTEVATEGTPAAPASETAGLLTK